MTRRLSFTVLAFVQVSLATEVFAWGETGHNVIGRVAAKVLVEDAALQAEAAQDPAAKPAITAFTGLVAGRGLQMGHLANVPDIHWRSYDVDGEDASLLGDGAHFFDSDMFLDARGDYHVSLDYETAKGQFLTLTPAGKFYQNGTMPWRAQQLFDLYVWNLRNYPAGACSTLTALPAHPTRTALTFAGIMTHFTGDASQPYHAAVDYDGVAANAKGIHSYFESTIVDGLEFGLDKDVYNRARKLLNAPAKTMHSVAWFEARTHELFGDYPADKAIVALVMALANDSLHHQKAVAALDAKYAIATAEEAWVIPSCATLALATDLKTRYDAETVPALKDAIAKTKVTSFTRADGTVERACRRDIETLVDRDGDASTRGRPVKAYFERMIVERLAVGAALTAHIWIKGFEDGGKPTLCSTYQYGMKPTFVSPTDPNCFGYALHESATDFAKRDGTSALPWRHSAATSAECVAF